MVKLKWMALGLLVVLALSLGGCAKRRADITIMDNFIEDSACGDIVNAPSLAFDAILEAWKADHPGVEIVEKKRSGSGDISALAVLGSEHMPDIFMASPTLGRLLAKKGLVMDLSDTIPEAERAEPFVYDGLAYAFPAWAPSVSLVVHEGDCPDSWTGLYARGYKVAWGGNAAGDLLGPALAARDAQAWLDHMAAADRQCTFLDDGIVEALTESVEMRASDILVQMSPDDAVQAFISRKYRAALLSGDSVYKLLDKLEPERRERLQFAAFPTISGGEYLPTGVQYGLFINAAVADDAGKLANCIDLCRRLARAARADRGSDATLRRLNAFVNRANPCRNCGLYLAGEVWSPLGQTRLSPIETAVSMQNAYDQYFLGIEDYSKQMDLYSE